MLVTGGASFIGSHLVHALLQRDAQVRVVDDLSSGRRDNLSARIDPEGLDFREADLLDPGVAEQAVEDVDVVFHLAAVHGGRGFVDTHQAETSLNFALDSLVIHAARAAGVQQFVFASSGCVYPVGMQMDVGQELFLAEDAVGPPYHADNIYGWAKLMTELTLRAFAREHGFRSVSCRLFTVFGEHGHENHAIHAMIARALVGQDPFEVWGDGRQVRNWTHVSDTVAGLLAGLWVHVLQSYGLPGWRAVALAAAAHGECAGALGGERPAPRQAQRRPRERPRLRPRARPARAPRPHRRPACRGRLIHRSHDRWPS